MKSASIDVAFQGIEFSSFYSGTFEKMLVLFKCKVLPLGRIHIKEFFTWQESFY